MHQVLIGGICLIIVEVKNTITIMMETVLKKSVQIFCPMRKMQFSIMAGNIKMGFVPCTEIPAEEKIYLLHDASINSLTNFLVGKIAVTKAEGFAITDKGIYRKSEYDKRKVFMSGKTKRS